MKARFHANFGKEQTDVWSLKKITKVESITTDDLFEDKHQNFAYQVRRGEENEIHTFTMADFPLINPNDFIVMVERWYRMNRKLMSKQ